MYNFFILIHPVIVITTNNIVFRCCWQLYTTADGIGHYNDVCTSIRHAAGFSARVLVCACVQTMKTSYFYTPLFNPLAVVKRELLRHHTHCVRNIIKLHGERRRPDECICVLLLRPIFSHGPFSSVPKNNKFRIRDKLYDKHVRSAAKE